MIKADLIGLQEPTLFFSLLLTYSQERHNVGDVNQKNFILKEFKLFVSWWQELWI